MVFTLMLRLRKLEQVLPRVLHGPDWTARPGTGGQSQN